MQNAYPVLGGSAIKQLPFFGWIDPDASDEECERHAELWNKAVLQWNERALANTQRDGQPA